jgi:uncharacterized protein (TIGR02246 family)
MRKYSVALVSIVLLVASGCVKKVDLEAERAAIMKADAEWGAAVAAKDAETFLGYFAADAVLQAPHLSQINGIDGIRQWATESMAFPGFAVTWQATSADVAASGDMGYTLGTFTFHMTMPDGSPVDDHGKYTTIWKKQADGTWKVAIDTFNSDVMMMPPPAPSDTTGAAGQ